LSPPPKLYLYKVVISRAIFHIYPDLLRSSIPIYPAHGSWIKGNAAWIGPIRFFAKVLYCGFELGHISDSDGGGIPRHQKKCEQNGKKFPDFSHLLDIIQKMAGF